MQGDQSLKQPETPCRAVALDNGSEAITCASACGVCLDPVTVQELLQRRALPDKKKRPPRLVHAGLLLIIFSGDRPPGPRN
jgi:hypothetical protein